jgi:hypothetical protein
MIIYSGEEGDAGVISHDWKMMIADMLLVEGSPYHIPAMRLQYWTQVRINDLKAGWDEGRFSVSYEMKFNPDCLKRDRGITKRNKEEVKKPTQKQKGPPFHERPGKNCVCVTIGGLAVVHDYPRNDTDCLCHHVTNVHTNEAESVRISVLDDEVALKDILTEITVFKRYVANDGVEGLVLAKTIVMGCFNESGVDVLLDVPGQYQYDKLGQFSSKTMTIDKGCTYSKVETDCSNTPGGRTLARGSFENMTTNHFLKFFGFRILRVKTQRK